MVTFRDLVYRVGLMRSKTATKAHLYYTLVMAVMTALTLTFFMAKKPGAQEATPTPCSGTDTACLLPELERINARITEAAWRDQTYRELAKLYMASGQTDQALALIPLVETPDTRAMTIRGIGMEAAKMKLAKPDLDKLFTSLRVEADKIDHPPSLGIALTYIAMSQAFAGDNAGAFATAKSMTNDALRHKAFGENAEIQAARGDLPHALESLAAIDDASFRNKAYGIVSKIFADQKMYDAAIITARKIENTYHQSQAMLYTVAKQVTPDEITLGIKE